MSIRDQIKTEIAQAVGSHDGHACLNLVYIDLDRFVYHNDAFGHASGDEVLKTILTALSDLSMQLSAHARRIGGDEFILYAISRTIDSHIELGKRAQQVVHELGIPLVYEGYTDGNVSFPEHITCSVATVSFPIQNIGNADHLEEDIKTDKSLIESLLHLLDLMLWLSKYAQRGNFVELSLCK